MYLRIISNDIAQCPNLFIYNKSWKSRIIVIGLGLEIRDFICHIPREGEVWVMIARPIRSPARDSNEGKELKRGF
jgi:hypothetical protein